jgi:hypothetical protein
MKTFDRVAAQGELRFIRLPDNFVIPNGATKIEPKNGHIIIGHSETGHHHVMDGECSTLYRLPDSILDCLLVVDKPDELRHLREFDTHESLTFKPGVYKITTGREYVPEGWRRSAD